MTEKLAMVVRKIIIFLWKDERGIIDSPCGLIANTNYFHSLENGLSNESAGVDNYIGGFVPLQGIF